MWLLLQREGKKITSRPPSGFQATTSQRRCFKCEEASDFFLRGWQLQNQSANRPFSRKLDSLVPTKRKLMWDKCACALWSDAPRPTPTAEQTAELQAMAANCYKHTLFSLLWTSLARKHQQKAAVTQSVDSWKKRRTVAVYIADADCSGNTLSSSSFQIIQI